MGIRKTKSSLPIPRLGKIFGKRNLRAKRSKSIQSPALDNKRLR